MFVCLNGYAQTPGNDLDDQYTPKGNELFSGKTKTASGRSLAELSVAFKAVPFELLRGSAVGELEIKVAKASSIVFGLGYSVLQDRILKAFNSGVGGPPSSSFLTSATMGYAMMLENSTFSKGGPYLSIGYRKYIKEIKFNFGYYRQREDDGISLNGWYRSISFSMNSMNYTIDTTKNYGGLKIRGSNKVAIKSFFLLSGYGYSFVLDKGKRTVHDFFVNLGFRVMQTTNFKVTEDYDPNTLQIIQYYSPATTVKFLFPSIHFGYSLGFGH
jgi:hypothetical protein